MIEDRELDLREKIAATVASKLYEPGFAIWEKLDSLGRAHAYEIADAILALSPPPAVVGGDADPMWVGDLERCLRFIATWEGMAVTTHFNGELRTAASILNIAANQIERLSALNAAPQPPGGKWPPIAVGADVVKGGGDYTFSGEVRAAFQKRSGVWRYAVENDAGILMIFNGQQLGLPHPQELPSHG